MKAYTRDRSSRSQIFFKICFLKNFANFTRKHLCWNHFLIKLQTWRSAILLKRDSNTDVSWEIWEIFKNTFLYRTPLVAELIVIIFIISTNLLPSEQEKKTLPRALADVSELSCVVANLDQKTQNIYGDEVAYQQKHLETEQESVLFYQRYKKAARNRRKRRNC